MQALALVGGKGTRLRPLTLEVPKPVLPLAGRPFLDYMVEWLGSHGVTEVIMACGFAADELRGALGHSVTGGPSITFVEEPEPRGTGGAVKFAERLLGDRFLVLNGDVLTDLDLTALLAQHEATGATATLGLYPVEEPSRYGLVRTDNVGRVTGFVEKPDPSEIDTDEISAGMYVLEREVLDLMPEGRECSIERDVWPQLVGNGLYGRRLEGYWTDIGTPQTYLSATWDILDGTVRTSVARTAAAGHVLVDPRADVDETAAIGPRAVVGPGSTIGRGARVEGSVVHGGCEIGEGAVVAGCVLGDGATVAAGERLEGRMRVGASVGAPDGVIEVAA